MVDTKGAAPPAVPDCEAGICVPEDCTYCPMPSVKVIEWGDMDKEPVCIYHQVILEHGMGVVTTEIAALETAPV